MDSQFLIDLDDTIANTTRDLGNDPGFFFLLFLRFQVFY
jgi:hypothetical protein